VRDHAEWISSIDAGVKALGSRQCYHLMQTLAMLWEVISGRTVAASGMYNFIGFVVR
jgi:hypothetical protein